MQSYQKPQYEIMENGSPGYYGVYYDLFSIIHYSAQVNCFFVHFLNVQTIKIQHSQGRLIGIKWLQ